MKVHAAMQTNVLMLTTVAALSLSPIDATAIEPTHRDVVYATVDALDLRLDVHTPQQAQNRPVIVWIHGGAWRAGSKKNKQQGLAVKFEVVHGGAHGGRRFFDDQMLARVPYFLKTGRLP
ncbi:MAG: carboxylesterase family protein [Fuerstiella sp.]|nr:carboxylesterase family protein [Fuerstiella sp.]